MTDEINITAETAIPEIQPDIQNASLPDIEPGSWSVTGDVNLVPEPISSPVITSQERADHAAIVASGVHHLNSIFKVYSDAANIVLNIISGTKREANWLEHEIKEKLDSLLNIAKKD